ncbi:MAG: hypothetical protein K2K30_00095 [Alistipes sp.]|nr:hypothetical protein [Alistipes sp.]
MFCPECGSKCCDDHIFCARCGTRLPAPAAKPSAPAPAVPSATTKEEPRPAEGAIFTNLDALARKLHTAPETIRRLLEAYAEQALGHGIRYRLLDAGDYAWLNPEAKGSRERLAPTKTWEEHIRLLADYYRYGRTTTREESCYLFIVGGDDVIPMPVLPQYVSAPDYSDTDIESDLPYAYLLGARTRELLRTAELFRYEQYFHVGRLPLAADATAEDLAAYLHRAAQACGAMRIGRAYGQTDRTWLSASASVCNPLRRDGLCTGGFRDERIYDRELFVSPCVERSVIDEVFDHEAGLYYFNLHGSDAPTACSFYASYRQQCYEAITPRQLAAAERPNVVVTEACYGGKFRDYGRNETMLLAALGGTTLLYLGSSRIAWGASESRTAGDLDNADRLTHVYMDRLLAGDTAGEALFRARRSFFDCNDGYFTPHQALTIVEFNLFGDPYLHLAGLAGDKAPHAAAPLGTGPINAVAESKSLYGSAAPPSVLMQVRQAVDRNLERIRAEVDRTLYARLGVEPRQLTAVTRMKYRNGEAFYAFDYAGRTGEVAWRHTATTDLDGNIKSIISTK